MCVCVCVCVCACVCVCVFVCVHACMSMSCPNVSLDNVYKQYHVIKFMYSMIFIAINSNFPSIDAYLILVEIVFDLTLSGIRNTQMINNNMFISKLSTT